jgi:hypothetical protein
MERLYDGVAVQNRLKAAEAERGEQSCQEWRCVNSANYQVKLNQITTAAAVVSRASFELN